MRDLLRTIALRTNPHWPFTYLNHVPYRLALASSIHALRGKRGVRSIYLRHSSKARGWEPGLSDIDLTVILEDGLSRRQDYELVSSCWRTFHRLRRTFPMLGEMELLSRSDLPLWLAYSQTGPGPARWTLLAGRENRLPIAADESGWRRRSINWTLWMYLELLPPCLERADSFLGGADVRRRVEKIVNQLRPIQAEAGHAASTIPANTEASELVATAAQALERAVAIVDPDTARRTEPNLGVSAIR